MEYLNHFNTNFIKAQYEGQLWTDETFKRDKALDRFNEHYFMTRASSKISNPKLIGQNGIQVRDAQQGSLGNCYFLAAIAALAQHPNVLRQIFVNGENPAGMYVTLWWIGGKPVTVPVDDYFPTWRDEKWIFSSVVGDSQIWPMVLEKAWAKLFGGYYKSQGGYARDVIHAITGAPANLGVHQYTSEQNLFSMMEDADKNKFFMGTYTQTQSCGIANLHAYTPLSVFRDVVASDGESYNLVQVRNPWGKNKWKGDFSEGSSLWTEQLKNKYNVVQGNGIFFMKISDYKKCFHLTSVAQVREGYTHSYMEFKNEETVTKRFKKQKSQTFVVMVEVPPQEFVPKGCNISQNFKYSLHKADQSKTKIGQASGTDSDITVHDGEAGEYQIQVQMKFGEDDSLVKSFVIHIYSSETNVRLDDVKKVCKKVDKTLKSGETWYMTGFASKYFNCDLMKKRPVYCDRFQHRGQNQGMFVKEACVGCGGGKQECA